MFLSVFCVFRGCENLLNPIHWTFSLIIIIKVFRKERDQMSDYNIPDLKCSYLSEHGFEDTNLLYTEIESCYLSGELAGCVRPQSS